ncbi:aspartyl protease family protein 2-like [Camellia sinensis]|uniref:aspartyl protease family protein 2-like n=1 Tax=Camellia sinensis TaxID=4442 RepID=UPI00103639C0|nr:aspartyl protease family protein 2-like [Camellia sinensis]
MASRATILIMFSSLYLSIPTALEHQTLLVTSLPNPHTLSSSTNQQDSQIPQPPNSQTSLSLQLHHRDSLFSNSTPESLFHLCLQHDASRSSAILRRAANFSSSVVSGFTQGSGEYFTRLGIGIPPKYSYMVLDTGSDVVWTQCLPCNNCYPQSDPLFNPKKSATFVGVKCGSPLCLQLDSGCFRKTFLYNVEYGNGSFTVGKLSTETLTFRGTRVKNIALGCGHDSEGLFIGAAGLLGLGRGKLSFPSQTGRRFGRKFSYCLVDWSASSQPSSITFGESAVSRTTVFTPLLTNPRIDTFYYVGLTGISVGGSRVKGITEAQFKLDATGNGDVIIDSGTSVTRLTQPAYTAFRNAFLSLASDLKRAPDFSLLDTCFNLLGKSELRVPTVVLHFVGADVLLPAANYLIPVDSKRTFCFAFVGMSGLSIIGNIQQQGFRVVYDLPGSRVEFSSNWCS